MAGSTSGPGIRGTTQAGLPRGPTVLAFHDSTRYRKPRRRWLTSTGLRAPRAPDVSSGGPGCSAYVMASLAYVSGRMVSTGAGLLPVCSVNRIREREEPFGHRSRFRSSTRGPCGRAKASRGGTSRRDAKGGEVSSRRRWRRRGKGRPSRSDPPERSRSGSETNRHPGVYGSDTSSRSVPARHHPEFRSLDQARSCRTRPIGVLRRNRLREERHERPSRFESCQLDANRHQILDRHMALTRRWANSPPAFPVRRPAFESRSAMDATGNKRYDR